MTQSDIINKIFKIKNAEAFEKLALEIFRLQYNEVNAYQEFCDLLNLNPECVTSLEEIPFLPIEFFKSRVINRQENIDKVFKSSGTTGSDKSSHYISDLAIYEQSFIGSFRNFIGNPEEQHLFSLLPSYRESNESSLIYMVDHLQDLSFNHKTKTLDLDSLIDALKEVTVQNKPNILIGVSFALMDLADVIDFELHSTTVIETGGMKGQKKEITREELHQYLHAGLRPKSVFSEYGMTELLSQAYCLDGSNFRSPPWMKIFLRDLHDPLTLKNKGIGGINIIDLANINSCSFIATSDLGRMNDDQFQVLGRFDYSDIRGCNLLY